MVIMQR